MRVAAQLGYPHPIQVAAEVGALGRLVDDLAAAVEVRAREFEAAAGELFASVEMSVRERCKAGAPEDAGRGIVRLHSRERLVHRKRHGNSVVDMASVERRPGRFLVARAEDVLEAVLVR